MLFLKHKSLLIGLCATVSVRENLRHLQVKVQTIAHKSALKLLHLLVNSSLLKYNCKTTRALTLCSNEQIQLQKPIEQAALCTKQRRKKGVIDVLKKL